MYAAEATVGPACPRSAVPVELDEAAVVGGGGKPVQPGLSDQFGVHTFACQVSSAVQLSRDDGVRLKGRLSQQEPGTGIRTRPPSRAFAPVSGCGSSVETAGFEPCQRTRHAPGSRTVWSGLADMRIPCPRSHESSGIAWLCR